jgi:hypothetical protein
LRAVLETLALVSGLRDIELSQLIETQVVIFGSPKTLGRSPKARLVATRIEVRS